MMQSAIIEVKMKHTPRHIGYANTHQEHSLNG